MASTYALISRLARLMALLHDDWEDQEWLMTELQDEYPPDAASAGRAFRRDIAALRDLGFVIEKKPGRDIAYAVRGHRRFPEKQKQCPDCERLLPLTAFGLDHSRASGHAIYCTVCANSRAKGSWAKYRERYNARARAKRASNPDAARARDHAAEQRRKIRRQTGKELT